MKTKVILLLAFVFTNAAAQWSQDPRVNTVWEQPENQGAPVICTDGEGGAIVAWGSEQGIRANRVDKFGYRQWGNNSVQISPLGGVRTPTNIIPDDNGGAIIVWEDFTKSFELGVQDNPENEMYVQRVDRDGRILWDSSGIVIRERIERTRIGDFQIVSSDYKSFMISWYDGREPIQWYVQRIDLNGQIGFEPNGRPIPHENKVNNGQRRVVSDGKGGMLMARGNDQLGLVVDKVTRDGKFPWPLGGIPTYTGGPIGMTSDGYGGAIITGIHFTAEPPDFDAEGRIQRIDSTGQLLWGEDGKTFASDADVQTVPYLVNDGNSGALVTWDDTTSGKRQRFVARFDSGGNILWKTIGFRLWFRSTISPLIMSNLKGSIIWLINDFDTLPGDLYAFRVDSSGAVSWGMEGILIRYRDFEEWPYFLEATTDGQGGFIAVWSETRGIGWQNLVLQQVSIDGKLGDVITSVKEDGEAWHHPADFVLYPTFPNPSNPSTKISFSLRKSSRVQIYVINIRGERVITLVDRNFAQGKYETLWNGLNQTGKEVSSGMYFIQMVVDGHSQIRKHILIH